MTDNNIVKGKTKSGIEFNINPSIKDDARLLFYMTKLHSEDAEEQNNALFSILELVFGGEAGLLSFMNAVASAHDGICSSNYLMDELKEMFDALNLKN